MSLYKLQCYTNINLKKTKYGGLDEKSSNTTCVNALLNLDYCNNKHIHPNAITILEDEKKISLVNNDFIILHENITLQVSYQIKCEYYLLKYLRRTLKKKNTSMFNLFFEKYNNKYISINTTVERRQSNRLRTDFDIELPNEYKIIIEINEKIHEKNKETDITRLRTILDNDPKIKKIYVIREAKFSSDTKLIKKFVDKILVPFVDKLESISSSDDEKTYVVNRLMSSTGNNENMRIICGLIYDSHNNRKIPIISINILNNYHNVNFDEKYKEHIALWCRKPNENKHMTLENNYDSDDDILSDVISDSDSDSDSDDIEEEHVSDYYVINNDNLKLTWLGLNAYYRFIHNYISPNKDKEIFKFFTKMITDYIDILKKERHDIIFINDNPKIWGFIEDDYKIIM